MTNYQTMKLGDVAIVLRGTTITRKQVSPGKIPVIAGGQTPSCYHNVSNRDGETITVSASGAYAGFLQYFNEPIFASDCSTIEIKDSSKTSSKFLFYMLQALQKEIYSFQRGSGQPHVYPSQLVGLDVPIPPLPEQQKIVEILEDHLSRLDAALADVKQAKLKASQFKVSFLRKVFTGDATWKSIPLKQIGNWRGGGTPSKTNQEFWVNGKIPWLSPKDMGQLEITDTQDKITEEACVNSTVKKVPENSVVFVVRSGILERKLPIALTRVETTLNQDMKAVTFSDKVIPKFGFYALLGFEQDILRSCRKSGTTVASINTESLMNYEIKIPSIPIQEKLLEYIESQLSQIDNSDPQAESVLQAGGSLRRSLLQAAFTGQLTKEVANV